MRGEGEEQKQQLISVSVLNNKNTTFEFILGHHVFLKLVFFFSTVVSYKPGNDQNFYWKSLQVVNKSPWHTDSYVWIKRRHYSGEHVLLERINNGCILSITMVSHRVSHCGQQYTVPL